MAYRLNNLCYYFSAYDNFGLIEKRDRRMSKNQNT